jgi:hypothetical protein
MQIPEHNPHNHQPARRRARPGHAGRNHAHTRVRKRASTLSKAGVPPRTTQAAMRHSDPSQTVNVYTDPKLLEVAEAVASLPDPPLGAVAGVVDTP